MSLHDFATVRLYDMGDYLEVFFTRGDLTTRDIVKGHRGRWDRNRRCWRVDGKWAGAPLPDIVEKIRQGILDAAPKGWRDIVPKMGSMCSVTRKYGIRFGEGGVRLELPRGHKHDWTLKEGGKAEKDDDSWLIPATVLDDPVIKKVVQEVVADDRKALGDALDYLEGFVIYGDLDLAEGEIASIGLQPGEIVSAEPSFVRKVDQGIPAEPIAIYPLRVVSIEKGEQGVRARLAFVTGSEAYTFLRRKLDPRRLGDPDPVLDTRHVTGRWARRRDS